MANILFLAIFSVTAWFHPLYVSVTEIEHDTADQALKVTMRIFIDDIETAIRQEINNNSMDITQPGEGYSTDQLIENYLADRFKIHVNGRETEYAYLGHEVELPVIFLYLKADKVKKLRDIKIKNAIIMEAIDDQTNLVHVKAYGDTKSLKLTNDQKEGTLSFQGK